MIRDKKGCLGFAYSVILGEGTSDWAAASVLHYCTEWCLLNGFQLIDADSNSKHFVDCELNCMEDIK